MPRHLLLVLEGPLLAFGGEVVDARGVVGDFPTASLLIGLLANALGWRRGERERHARLQARLVFAARIDREGERITDFQTAQLGKDDRGWTTSGTPEERAGGPGTYAAPHIRLRDYDADKRVTVALRLDPAGEAPDLEALAAALESPARPLFLGRKTCLPSRPLLGGLVEAEGLLAALASLPPEPAVGLWRILLPATEPTLLGDERRWAGDLRDWHSGVHGGGRTVLIRHLAPPRPDAASDDRGQAAEAGTCP
ncbi:type I-E CRISPR-associated protein Cas5/CasD [Siccirubricoccus sp. KC 17139]|uniref:Type I-E CRISPR-associated protein Cas5/CasD n=1 Tax=Siccirubricoccus soli TaxID=2899147 RepID=A0ABT1D287_9PROT|nr:type I-E CRISPR-associated protein Cas5/CasD [Siccirubricoccus soli]MCO6416036.1 type I-E CRISPR-associated protein Cas5/CasD [Siccirubricoccus soli]MCP2682168.1 type I-E CRISPR-associated protein Cas5/CasD [Siccirubricoccus soli]